MPITRTATFTATYTRQDLIELQISRLLGRVNASRSYQDAIMKGVRYKWIGELSLYGMNYSDRCKAELYVKVDWQQNRLQVAAGKDSIQLDSSWTQGVSVEVEKTLSLFSEYIKAEHLSVTIRTRYAPGVDREHANRVLGFETVERVKWASGSIGTAMSIPELDEFTIGINFAQ
jgi:hypothetical protein